jgi:hypothetical protein
MKKKKKQVGDLVEMCWDPRYTDLKMGIIVDFDTDKYASVMWKEGDITREWSGNLTTVSERVRADIAWYNISKGRKQ